MKTRAITGIFFVAAMLASVLLGEYVFSVFLLFLSLLCLDEFYRLVKTDNIKPLRIPGIILGLGVFIPIGSYFLKGDEWTCILIAVPLSVLIFLTELYRKNEAPFHNIAYTFLGIIFAVIPFSFFHALGFIEGVYNFHFPLGFLLMLWAHDTGAYLFGIKFGKNRLFERHSPKKSWEGLFGGIATSLLVSWILSIYYKELPAIHWAGISLIIAVFGTYGDLVESMMKRSMDKKDSGSLLPGHGGLLDRFDGLLLSAPLVFIYLYMVLVA
ncbi:MAG TPA: phosphatidate cytidylyltransferase [Sphingobacteriaceae bacterium]|nr:phosphatidate cytidylyltransferase [Sphingobacteriaceae bacterium]